MNVDNEIIEILQAAGAKSKEVASVLKNKMTSTHTEYYLSKFITRNAHCEELKLMARKWSLVQDPILITGETGTGKELIAQSLHGHRTGKFVPVNCAGFVANEGLMESILFGHIKGSFTGAVADSKGLVALSSEGTLFLDEVAELPFHVQAKLLRLIQEGKYRPLGSTEEVPIKTRIVCATKEPLEKLVELGRFREDLYYRISVGRLHIKPLRERREDILPILEYYYGGELPKDFPIPKDDDLLKGNVRELYNLVRRFKVEKQMDFPFGTPSAK